ncbi:MAG: DUF938 domain-containing protein [Paracoccaceae bacterium]
MTLRLPDSGAATAPDGRRLVPSAERNAPAILAVLLARAPRTGRMLELAAGSGLHAAQFAQALPGLDWQPTDRDAANFGSIKAWAATSAGTIRPPQVLDAAAPGWSAQWPDRQAILLVNLLHLIPESAAETVLSEIALALAPGGVAFVYGPFLRGGAATSEGDARFDAALRAQDPAIGYKDIAWVQSRLDGAGLASQVLPMPANNLMILAQHPGPARG